MSLRVNSKYEEGFDFLRIMPLNADLSKPKPSRIVGGVGPFDFSSAVVPAAVTMKWKIDNGAEQSDTFSLAGVGDIAAVTVDELVTAVNLTTPAGLTASKESVTLRFKIAMTTPGATVYLQVYGELSLAGIGQGYGCKFRKSDTMKSFQETPTQKADETITTTDANGKDTEMIADGYRKGFSGTLVDTTIDPDLLEVIEGGINNPTTGVYENPLDTSQKPTFYMEVYKRLYNEGANKEADLAGIVQRVYRSCKGAVGAMQHQRGWSDGNYTVVGTAFTDETGARFADVSRTILTLAQYEALALETV